jgi:hypothetical protein
MSYWMMLSLIEWCYGLLNDLKTYLMMLCLTDLLKGFAEEYWVLQNHVKTYWIMQRLTEWCYDIKTFLIMLSQNVTAEKKFFVWWEGEGREF